MADGPESWFERMFSLENILTGLGVVILAFTFLPETVGPGELWASGGRVYGLVLGAAVLLMGAYWRNRNKEPRE